MYIKIKRILDIIISLSAMIIFFPLFVVTICLLRFSGEGEVFYRQERIGYKNKKFKIWKFATMIKNSPNLGNGDVTLREDPRITSIGKYLRITKINELPQIYNIFNGDISVVGPRPLMEAGFSRYNKYYQSKVYNVKPGLTGIGAVVFRDEEKILTESDLHPHECYKREILPYKGALEIWYQKHQSFRTDMLLILLTVWAIIYPKNNIVHLIFKDLPKYNTN